MKNKTSNFTGKNSFKLFLGVFISVASLFALLVLVQNSLFQKEPEAATIYTYTVNVRPTVRTTNCNSKISYYVVTSSFISSFNTSYVVGSASNTVAKTSPANFTAKVSSYFKGPVIAKQKVVAYTATRGYIGSITLGVTASIAPNGNVTQYITIPCNIF